MLGFSPVHVVLVSLLVNQLFGLFIIFFGRPIKKLSSLREFLVSLWEFLVHQKEIWSTKKNFGTPKKILVHQKEIWWTKNSQRLTKNSLRLDKFFFGQPKKMRKRPDNRSTKRLTKTTWTGLSLKFNPLPFQIADVFYGRPQRTKRLTILGRGCQSIGKKCRRILWMFPDWKKKHMAAHRCKPGL